MRPAAPPNHAIHKAQMLVPESIPVSLSTFVLIAVAEIGQRGDDGVEHRILVGGVAREAEIGGERGEGGGLCRGLGTSMSGFVHTGPVALPGEAAEASARGLESGWGFQELVEREDVAGRSVALNHVAYYAGGVAVLFLLFSAVHGAISLIEERDGLTNTLQFTLSVHNRKHLANIMRRIRGIDSVMRISRLRS